MDPNVSAAASANKKTILLSVALLVVIVVAVYLVYGHRQGTLTRTPPPPPPSINPVALVTASKGALADPILKAFVIEKDAVITGSSVNAALQQNGQGIYTLVAHYTTATPLSKLVTAYTATLGVQQYSILKTDPETSGTTIFAAKKGSSITLVISQTSQTQSTVGVFITKPQS